MIIRKNTETIEELTQENVYNIYTSKLTLLDKEVEFYKIMLCDGKLRVYFINANKDDFYYESEELADLIIKPYIAN